MYAFMRGIVAEATPAYVVVDVQGIGYRVSIPASAYGKLPQLGSEVLIHTSLVIRENAHTLYGFLQAHERDCFESLMGVTGIGPKLALSIIGHLAIPDLHTAIASGDIPSLCKIPGIGRKTAERLLIEMRDKLPAMTSCGPATSLTISVDPRAQTIRDAMSALINLGYSQVIAQKAIKNSLKDHSGEDDKLELSVLITAALKNI